MKGRHLPHADYYPNGTVRTYLFVTSLIQVLWDTARDSNISYRTTVNPVNVWGNRLPNGSWTGFLGELQRNESDVSFTLFSPTVDRNQLADASDPVWYEEVVILGGFSEASAHQMSIFGSFTVFGLEVWLTLLGCLIALPFVASLAPNSEHTFLYNLNNFAFRLLATVFLESSPRTPRQVSARIVIAFWWLAMLVLTNVFSAEMKAALTVRQPSGHRVESASDLAHRDDVKAYTMHGTVYHLLLAYSPREDDRQVASKLTPNFRVHYHRLYSPAVLDEVANGRAVIIADRTSAAYQITKACHSYPGHEFYFGRERLFSHMMVIYYGRHRHPQLTSVMKKWNTRMNWLIGAGVLNKWHDDTESLAGDFSRCPKVRMGEAEQLDFEHHQPIFILFLAGHALALVALLAEVTVSRIAAPSATSRRPLRIRRTYVRRINSVAISP
ncbi:glutamate receptor ionotropic, kainate glr-3-like isoform X2 [Rhipicephalus microplus]|uniref:glutamate receptor ionotropic, kainate glr-3-like isoform X2 n=1 Tax=Rhipicephalus microplus TaxID=6941 RepID=UPI003F6B709A